MNYNNETDDEKRHTHTDLPDQMVETIHQEHRAGEHTKEGTYLGCRLCQEEIQEQPRVNNMSQNDTTEDEEPGFERLRCTVCEDSVDIILKDSQHYAVCHCTNADGELDRMELDSLAFLHPRRWEYV